MNGGPAAPAAYEASHFSNPNVAGTATVGGALTVNGGIYPSSTKITPTAGQTITPVFDLYVIDASAAVTITLAACSSTGKVVTLVGEDNYTITVADTNVYVRRITAE